MDKALDCLDEETILGFIEGRLGPDELAGVELHARRCRPCQERLSAGFAAMVSQAAAPGPAGVVREPPASSPLARGDLVDRYVVLNLVGRGGMGEVYAAHDPKLNRTIALKLLRPSSAAQAAAGEGRLMREAQAIAQLSHPNVITVYDVGAHGDRVFLAMEYVEGQTLSAWLAERPRSAAEVAAAFRQAARGLAAAHAAGLVHRDFKPQNVMVGRDGAVRVTDFGLARRIDAGVARDDRHGARSAAAGAVPATLAAEITLTKTGELVGTPLYMAPEQLDGQSADARSDQLSFCVALYEALYGEHPFLGRRLGPRPGGAELGDLLGALRAAVVRPAPARAGVPSSLRRIVLRGLARDPDRRWPSMDHLIAGLADPPAPPHRRPALIGAAALAAVAAIVGLTRVPPLRERGRALAAAPPPAPASTVAAAPEPAAAAGTSAGSASVPRADPPGRAVATSRRSPRARPRALRVAETTAAPTAPEAGAAPAEATADALALLRPAEERLGLGRIAEGCALGQRAAARAPESPAVWEFLGRCYMRMAEPQEARAYYRRYLALDPTGPSASFIRAIVEREAP